MKLLTANFRLGLLVLTTLLAITACGGGNDAPEIVYTINADTTELNFVHAQGEELSDKRVIKVNFDGNGVLLGFAPSAPLAPWLSFEAKNVTDNSAEIHIDLNNSQFLAAADIKTTIRISTGDVNEVNLASTDVIVKLKIWQLQTNVPTVTFDAKFEEKNTLTQSIAINSSTTEWTLAPDQEWVSVDVQQGSGESEVVVSVDPTILTEWGNQQANLVFTEVTTGDTKNVPVSFAIDAVRLFTSDNAVALSQVGNNSQLSQTIEVYNNAEEQNIDWQASTSAAWLSLTQDSNSNTLTLTAKPSSVSVGLHTTVLTISSTGDNKAIEYTIPVSFYKQSASAEPVTLPAMTINSNALQTDPLRPYLYLYAGNNLMVYHTITGEQLANIQTPVDNGEITSLVVHPKGDHVLINVTPENAEADTTRDTLVKLDTKTLTMTVVDESELNQPLQYNPHAYLYVEGLEFVVSQVTEYATPDFNRVFYQADIAASVNLLRQPANQASFYILELQRLMYRYQGVVNQFVDNSLAVGRTHSLTFANDDDSQIRDFFIDDNEQNLYLGSFDTEWLTFNGETFEDKATLHGSDFLRTFDVARADDGTIYFLRINAQLENEFAKYNSQQTLISEQTLSTTLAYQAQLSNDGLRVVTVQDNDNGESIINIVDVE